VSATKPSLAALDLTFPYTAGVDVRQREIAVEATI